MKGSVPRRSRRKHLARTVARRTGRPVVWKDGRLIFKDSGSFASSVTLAKPKLVKQ